MFFQNIILEKELIFKEMRGDSEEHELHIHDILEYHILLENEATFKLSHKQYDGKPGDVFLFRPFEPHWNLVKDHNQPIRWISILFSPSIVRFIPNGYKLLTPFYAVETVSPHLLASSLDAQAIHKLASQAILEEKTKQISWEVKQFMLFIDILIHTLRHTVDHSLLDKTNPEDAGKRIDAEKVLDQGIIQAIEYILAHFTEEIDVEQLIRMSGRQRTFFYQNFNAVTAVTPNQFIHRLRMQVAIYLLEHTEKSVTEIAFESGYSSIHYFNKHFKAYRGVSPREYRKWIISTPRRELY